MSNLGALTLDLIAKIGGFLAPLDQADRRVRQSQKNMEAFGKASGRAVKALAAEFVALVSALATVQKVIDIGKLGAGFEQSLANARAVMRGTAQDMQRLADVARFMGKTTEFTASQSAEALNALGQAGFSASEAIQALPNVLQLAAASGMDLAQAAKLTDDALDAFGLKVTDVAALNDVLVGAATRSGLKIEDLAEALKTVGPIANQLGVSVQDAAAIFGVLAQSGIDASTAAAQLNIAFLKNKDAAKELGTAQEDLVGTLKAARAAGWDLNKIVDVYGPKAAKVVVTILDQIDAFDKLRGELNNVSGETRTLAEIRLDTLAGDFKKLQGVIEEAGLQAFDSIHGQLRGALAAVADFIQENQGAINTFFNILVFALKALASAALLVVGAIELVADAIAIVLVTGEKFVASLRKLSLSDLLDPVEGIGKIGDAFKDAGSAYVASSGLFTDSAKKYAKSFELLWSSSSESAPPLEKVATNTAKVEQATGLLGKTVKGGNVDWEERADLLKEVAKLELEMRTATEKHADEMANLNLLVDKYKLNLVTYSRAVIKANDELAKAIGHEAASKRVNPFGLPDELFFSQNDDKKKKQEERMKEGADLMEKLRTPTEKYAAELAHLNELYAKGAILPETYARAVAAAGKELADSTKVVTSASEAQENLEKFFKEGAEATKSARTVTEEYADEIKRLNDLLNGTANSFYQAAISQETFNRAAKAAGEKGFEKSPQFDESGHLDPMGKLNEEEKEQNKWYAKQIELLNQYRATKLGAQEDWDAKEAEINKEHQEELSKIETARLKMMLHSSSEAFGDMASIIKTFAGEQSGTYKAMFALSKAFALAEATVNMYLAISNTGAKSPLPFPANIAAMAAAAASMAAIIASISSAGMAHEGMDSIPQSGSWLLQKGERVTTEKTSKRLDRTLDRIEGNRGSGPGGMSDLVVNIHEAPGTAAQVTKRNDGGLEVNIALIEGKLLERMNRGTGLAGPLDSRYGRRY